MNGDITIAALCQCQRASGKCFPALGIL